MPGIGFWLHWSATAWLIASGYERLGADAVASWCCAVVICAVLWGTLRLLFLLPPLRRWLAAR